MHYPWWYVPGLTAPMLIAAVAVVHIYIAQYAVGGGIIVAVLTGRAHRERDEALLGWLKGHTAFFVFFTLVFGALTGVGIWWTISLAAPLGTEALTHVFVFAWTAEWVAFTVEIVAALVFYYFWGRLRPETHTRVGWIYAVAAWVSLFIICGITGFQLNPGGWPQGRGFWSAFCNPQLVPQTLARTGGSLLLATLYLYAHAAFRLGDDPELRARVVARVSRFTLPAAALVVVGGVGWFAVMPPSGQAVVEGTGAMNVFSGLVASVTMLVVALAVYGPLRDPRQMSRPLALAMLGLGFIAIGASEFMREATRKPFVIYDVVYGHGIWRDELPRWRREGLLRDSVWPAAYARRRYPELVDPADGEIDPRRLTGLSGEARRDLGRTLFLYHCNDCHALRGYAGLHGLVRGWTPRLIDDVVRQPERYHFFMPPWSGTEEEAAVLAEWIVSIAPPHPIDYSDVEEADRAAERERGWREGGR